MTAEQTLMSNLKNHFIKNEAIRAAKPSVVDLPKIDRREPKEYIDVDGERYALISIYQTKPVWEVKILTGELSKRKVVKSKLHGYLLYIKIIR